MSSHAHSGATANAENPVASRTRRQARERSFDDDENDNQKQPVQSSTHVSPAMRIYRHALESIFAMLELRDLSRALAVSRSWSAAVRSMKSVGARIHRDSDELRKAGKHMCPLPPIDALVKSPLLRHVAALEIRDLDGRGEPLPTAPTNEALALLAQHAPHLTSLGYSLTLTPAPAPLIFPANLTSLELRLSGKPSPGQINGVFTTLAALPSLQRLVFYAAALVGVDFNLLGASPSLRDLSVPSSYLDTYERSDKQLAQIRSSLGHLQRFTFGDCNSTLFARLLRLQPPVTMRWQDIGWTLANAHTGPLLATLPTLTRIEMRYSEAAPHADFLSAFPQLTALSLSCVANTLTWPLLRRTWYIPAAALLTSLLPCTGLTELDLECGFNSAQVSTLLATLTKLRKFKLWSELESLQCFASGPATRTLEELFLGHFDRLPQAELVHLSALQRLQTLTIEQARPLDKAAIDVLCPPSALLPRLTRFVCGGRDTSGPSFEWMETRLTQ